MGNINISDDFYFEICCGTQYSFTDDDINNISNTEFDLLFLGLRLKEKTSFVNSFLIKPGLLNQTHAYLISLGFSKFVVNNFNYLDKDSMVCGEQIDTYFSVLASKKHWKMEREYKDKELILNNNFKIYCYYPVLFNQRPSFSNITNKKEAFNSINYKFNLENYPS